MRRVLVLALTLAASAAAVTRAVPAGADEVAPELETLELRQKAQGEAKKLIAALPANDQKRLSGVYVAFDPSPSDPSAMAACDDDGDFVIVLTDAMLRLISAVARAQSFDEANASRTIEDYASFIGRSQLPGRRLLPPPPGSYTAQKAGTAHDTRLREALAFVVARELTHFRAGDLVCPHPTATRESGDDEWTASEQRRAMERAATLYPGRAHERDIEATSRVMDLGHSERGALGLLRFFMQLELERTTHAARFIATYAALHPSASTRTASVMGAAKDHRSE